jgi:hypothetical protein
VDRQFTRNLVACRRDAVTTPVAALAALSERKSVLSRERSDWSFLAAGNEFIGTRYWQFVTREHASLVTFPPVLHWLCTRNLITSEIVFDETTGVSATSVTGVVNRAWGTAIADARVVADMRARSFCRIRTPAAWVRRRATRPKRQ